MSCPKRYFILLSKWHFVLKIQSSSPRPKFFIFQWSVSLRCTVCHDTKEKVCHYFHFIVTLRVWLSKTFWSSGVLRGQIMFHFERKPQHEQNSWKTTVHSILVKATVTCWSFRNLLWVLITISKWRSKSTKLLQWQWKKLIVESIMDISEIDVRSV